MFGERVSPLVLLTVLCGAAMMVTTGIAVSPKPTSEGRHVLVKKTVFKKTMKDGKVVKGEPQVTYERVFRAGGEKTPPKRRQVTTKRRRTRHTGEKSTETVKTTTTRKRRRAGGAAVAGAAMAAPAVAAPAGDLPPPILREGATAGDGVSELIPAPSSQASLPPQTLEPEAPAPEEDVVEQQPDVAASEPTEEQPPPEPVRRVIKSRKRGRTKYMKYSDPQNYGLRFCWKFVMPVRSPYNWGYIVNYSECLDNPKSAFYQETTDVDVCTDTGGVEIINMPFDGSSLPYKVACIPRAEALKSNSETCWGAETRVPSLKLKKLSDDNAESVCAVGMPWAFHDGHHVSSRFDKTAGGVDSLFHCNGGRYTSATVMYRMSDDGQIEGFGRVVCQPHGPIPRRQCKGACLKCMPYHPPAEFEF